MSDEEFVAGFENGTLPNENFHHTDHVRMGFLYLTRYPPLEALRRFSETLKGFARANGKPERYHETITWAYLLLIRERLARARFSPTWSEFAEENSDLLSWKDNILRNYYRSETLASDFARTTFVLPDSLRTCLKP